MWKCMHTNGKATYQIDNMYMRWYLIGQGNISRFWIVARNVITLLIQFTNRMHLSVMSGMNGNIRINNSKQYNMIYYNLYIELIWNLYGPICYDFLIQTVYWRWWWIIHQQKNECNLRNHTNFLFCSFLNIIDDT